MHPNTYWYLGLAVPSLALVLFLCLTGNRLRRFFLYTVFLGFGFLAEAIIYAFLGSYQYFPKLLKEPFFDSNLGAISSNQLALPGTAVLISVYQVGWKGILFASGVFVGIEWFFVKLGIYVHYWWRLSYTAIILPFYYALAKDLYRRLAHPMRGFIHMVTLYWFVGAITGGIHLPPTMLVISRSYHPGWFASPGREITAFASVYYLFTVLLVLGATYLRWKYGWLKYALPVAVQVSVTQVLVEAGIVRRLVWWDLPYYMVGLCVLLWLSERISKRLSCGLGEEP